MLLLLLFYQNNCQIYLITVSEWWLWALPGWTPTLREVSNFHCPYILTNILGIFFNICSRSVWYRVQRNKQTKTTQQQIQSHLKKVAVYTFPVVSNETTQELNSVTVNKHSLNKPRPTKQWRNERLPKLVPVPPSWKYFETNGAARTWRGPDCKVLRRSHKKKRKW